MKRFIPEFQKSLTMPFRNMNSIILNRKFSTCPRSKMDYNPLNECESNRKIYKCPDKFHYNPLNECESNRKFPESEKKEKYTEPLVIAFLSFSAAMLVSSILK